MIEDFDTLITSQSILGRKLKKDKTNKKIENHPYKNQTRLNVEFRTVYSWINCGTKKQVLSDLGLPDTKLTMKTIHHDFSSKNYTLN